MRKLKLALIYLAAIVAATGVAYVRESLKPYKSSRNSDSFELSPPMVWPTDDSGYQYNDPLEPNRFDYYLIYRASFMPFLEDVYSNPPRCSTIVKDEGTEKMLSALHARDEGLSFIDKQLLSCPQIHRNGMAELKHVMDLSEQHLTFKFANRNLFANLHRIWKNNPCSAAGVQALIEMKPTRLPGDPAFLGEYERLDTDKLDFFILGNYPPCQQTYFAVVRIRWGFTSQEYYETYQKLLDERAKTDPLGMKNGSAEQWQSMIFWYYMRQCEQRAVQEVSFNGRLSRETIDLYRHGWRARRKEISRYNNVHQLPYLPDCYAFIKQYAPDYYLGDPPICNKPRDEVCELREP